MINIRTKENVKEIKIGLSLNSMERKNLKKLLEEYPVVFAWSYKDMPRISTEIAEHTIPLIPDAKPIK